MPLFSRSQELPTALRFSRLAGDDVWENSPTDTSAPVINTKDFSGRYPSRGRAGKRHDRNECVSTEWRILRRHHRLHPGHRVESPWETLPPAPWAQSGESIHRRRRRLLSGHKVEIPWEMLSPAFWAQSGDSLGDALPVSPADQRRSPALMSVSLLQEMARLLGNHCCVSETSLWGRESKCLGSCNRMIGYSL